MKAPRMMVLEALDTGGSWSFLQMVEAMVMNMMTTVNVSGMMAPSTMPAR